MRLTKTARAALRRHAPRTRWLVLAAAVTVPVGIAAVHTAHDAGHARGVAVRYLSRGLLPKERAQLTPLVAELALAHGTIHGDLDHARPLVSVTLRGHQHVFIMAPLTHGVGGCFFEIADHSTVNGLDCGYDPKRRQPAVSDPNVVGVGTALGAEAFPVGGAVQVVLGAMPAKRHVVSVTVRFQDGTTTRAPTNAAFFAYVISGRHLRAGHRPTALLGLTDAGKVAATQPLGSGWFG